MYAPRVFISMMGALLVFAVATYFIHGSFYTAFIQTLICLVIIQVGYFIGVIILVAREKRHMRETLAFSRERAGLSDQSTTDAIILPPAGAKLTDI